MLISLHVKNFALIDEVEIEFGEQLNILTGETGAGKSILIGSIQAALGGKVSKEMIRNNAKYALIELLFETNNKAVLDKINEKDIENDGSQILITRKITANGKNINKINGETVTAATMREITSVLLDLHGQHEHQSLLQPQKHLEFIDCYAKEETEELKKSLSENYHAYAKYKKELLEAEIDEEEKLRELSFLDYEIHEIEAAKLIQGEDDELQTEFKRLSNANHIAEGMAEIDRYLTEDDASAGERISRSVRILTKLTEYDEDIQDYLSQMIRIEDLINDVNRDVSGYISDMDNREEEFKEVENRLDIINHLKSRYGKTVDDILVYLDKSKARKNQLQQYDQYVEELRKKIKAKEEVLEQLSKMLSDIRKKKAALLTKKMTEALIELNFLDVRFDMIFTKLSGYTSNGYDAAEFIISTNPGEEMQPLRKIASGGELSRIMLALKSVLADKDDIETLIFDEIDVGVSGRTAQKVSEKMAFISRQHQVICITHLPQITAMADSHYLIEKTTDGVTTKTDIILLQYEQSVKELARILGGVEITEHVMRNAEEMKELAVKTKNKYI